MGGAKALRYHANGRGLKIFVATWERILRAISAPISKNVYRKYIARTYIAVMLKHRKHINLIT